MKISNSSEAITENPKNNIQSPELTKKLPFSFVKKHKILINSVTTNSVEVVYFEDVPLEIISETRRFAERPLSLKKVSSLEFDELLRKSYEENSQTNIQIYNGKKEIFIQQKWDKFINKS